MGYQNQIEKLVFAYKKNYEQLLQNINNDKKEHSVDNFGDTDRVHLIVDWIEESLFKKYDLNLTKKIF